MLRISAMHHPACICVFFSATLWFAPMMTRAQPRKSTMPRVRVLDSHKHRALNGQTLQLTFTNMSGGVVSNGLVVEGRTGKGGVATFEIAQPTPPRFSIFVWYAVPCFRTADFATKQVLDSGVVANWTSFGIPKLDKLCAAEPNAVHPSQSPGEVEIYVHPQNRFVWAWEDTWR
jgi:hypothetical protein